MPSDTPKSLRHVAIFGGPNSGKSALFNAIVGAPAAVVSETSGTTTNPVYKETVLRLHGPVVLIDTAGLGDGGACREERVLNITDFAIYAIDINSYDEAEYERAKRRFALRNIPHMVAFTKKDVSDIEKLVLLSRRYENTIIVSVVDKPSIEALKLKVAHGLNALGDERVGLIDGLMAPGCAAVIVVCGAWLSSAQSQFLRDCLAGGVRALVTAPDGLEPALAEMARVDMVVAELKGFAEAALVVPPGVPLTALPVLQARQKGVAAPLASGAQGVAALKDGDCVLIVEACAHDCVHNRSSESLARENVPDMLEGLTGKPLVFEFTRGGDFPGNLSRYALVAHCAGCKVTRREMCARIERCAEAGVPVTNYDMLAAYAGGVLERAMENI